MSVIRLASRYAKSLLELSKEQSNLEEVYEDMQLFQRIVRANSDFVLMLKSPIIKKDKKTKILDNIFRERVNDITLNFFRIIVAKKREYYLPEIARAFVEQYHSEKGIVVAKFTTAVVIEERLVKKIKQIIKEATKAKEIELSTIVDEDIIGGLVLQYGDKLYDASISGKLEALKGEFSQNRYIKKF